MVLFITIANFVVSDVTIPRGMVIRNTCCFVENQEPLDPLSAFIKHFVIYNRSGLTKVTVSITTFKL